MGFLKQIKDSFTKFDAYVEFSTQKTSKTLRYLLILFTLVYLIGGIRVFNNFRLGSTDIVNTVKNKLPQFTMVDGELIVEGKQPLIFGGNQTILIIDTTGQTTEKVLDRYTEGVFISKDVLVSKQNYQEKVIKFVDFKGISLDKERVLNWLPMLKWLVPAIIIIGWFFGVSWAIITTLILAVLGNLMTKKTVKNKLQFANLWNIAVYALSLPWLLEMAKNLIYPTLPYFFVIKWGAAVFIMQKAVEAAGKTTEVGEPLQQLDNSAI